MHPKKGAWLAINGVGGAAVIGSYLHGLSTHPETRDALWGTIPDELKAVYTGNMLLAAVGYFLFSYYFMVRTDADQVRFGERFGFDLINALYALILGASALWMPLTFAYLESPSPTLWVVVRAVLLGVAIGSIGLIVAFFAMKPRAKGVSGVLALLGLLVFALQTAFLDALVWTRFF